MIKDIYSFLLDSYGVQGWWPLVSHEGGNPTKTGSIKGYHPGDYNLPKSRDEVYEVCVGAILTQNTAWVNVEKALLNLKKFGALNPESLLELDDEVLKDAIRPAGYFNQKARKIKEFTVFFVALKGRVPPREELLSLWGVGKETADSMLLYAFKIPTFVVDAYTRRIFGSLGLVDGGAEYDEIKAVFESAIKPDLVVYQEYHALIVEHAKRYYNRKSDYVKCPLYEKFVLIH